MKKSILGIQLQAFALAMLLIASAVHAADTIAPVNLNTATESEIEALPGIGKKSAEKIIANRPYSSAADLSKAGLSAKKISKLSDHVTFGEGAAASAPAAAASEVAPPSPAPVAKHSVKPSAAKSAESAEGSSVTAQTPPQPGMVWVNSKTKVYHTEGDRYYGKTKNGKWMTEADAIKAGDRKSKQE